ncbi:MAG: hypothetical protein ACXADO_00605 [Candidatus Thorarchaeota archaeon]|jgi:hypothetical protein
MKFSELMALADEYITKMSEMRPTETTLSIATYVPDFLIHLWGSDDAKKIIDIDTDKEFMQWLDKWTEYCKALKEAT